MKTKNEINLSFKIKDISAEALKTLLKPTKETEEMIKKFNDSLERDCKTLADAYFSEIEKSLSVIFNPKFKVGDKVKLNGKYEYEVYKVSKKGNCDYRYNLQSDTRERLTMVRECKLTKVEEPTTEPKFKVGDWVRVKNVIGIIPYYVDKVYQIVKISERGGSIKYDIKDPKNNREFHTTLTNSLEPYYPKCGEFFYCELKHPDEPYKFVGCKSDAKDLGSYILKHYYAYLVNLEKSLDKGNYLCRQCDVLSLRPATEDEILQLKEKVKKEHNQEWNGTDWVDIKKSDKELFEKWKAENKARIKITSDLYSMNRLAAYGELLLFAEWVNQFYEIESKYYIVFNTFDNGFKIEGYCTYNHSGAINFHSHEAAQRAIDCLGEQLIKTALR